MLDTTGGIDSVAQARTAFCAVNSHCLEGIVRVAHETEVIATVDIIDESGMKLLDRGAMISRSIQATLRQRRLQTPLEASLDVAHGATPQIIVADCHGLLNTVPALALLGGADGARGISRAVGKIPLNGPLKLLLTLARRLRKGRYDNSLAAMIICSGLAQGVGLSEHDGDLLILSALVQDIGESYIDPDILAGNGALPVEQWRNVAVHPLVGHAFLTALTDFPPALADGVLQHHERQDGSGYPFARRAATMTALGTLIGLADCVSAVVMGGHVAGDFGHDFAHDSEPYSCIRDRVGIALSIVPDEFPPLAIACVGRALAPLTARGAGIVGGIFAQRILPTLQQIRAARLLAEALSHQAATPGLGHTGEFALSAIRLLDKRLRMTGVYDISLLGRLESDPERMGQTCLVLDEVKWRLRHLARSVYLQTEQNGSTTERSQVAELVAVLGTPG